MNNKDCLFCKNRINVKEKINEYRCLENPNLVILDIGACFATKFANGIMMIIEDCPGYETKEKIETIN